MNRKNFSKLSAQLFLVIGFLLSFSIVSKAVTLWHNTNTTTITSNNSISCNNSGSHTNNSYWRSFTPSNFGQTGTFTITGVRIGIEEATASSGSQPITVRVYTNSGGAFPSGTRTLIGTTNTTVANGNLTFQDIAVTAPIQSATTEIVVEVFTPDGQALNNRFFIGSNTLGQSAASYISAAPCAVNNPTDISTLGAPNMHTLIGLTGNVTTATNSSVSGRLLTPTGRGLSNSLVTLTDTNTGVVRYARSSSFGYFSFENCETGHFHILSVSSKKYRFTPQTFTLNGDLNDLVLIGEVP